MTKKPVRTKTVLVTSPRSQGTKPPVVVKKAVKKPVVRARKEGRKGMAEYREERGDPGLTPSEEKAAQEGRSTPLEEAAVEARERESTVETINRMNQQGRRPRTDPPTPPLSIEEVLKWMEEESYRQHGEVDASCCRRLVQLARVRVAVIEAQPSAETKHLLATEDK